MIDKLEYLLALAQEKHFGRTADDCNGNAWTVQVASRNVEPLTRVTSVPNPEVRMSMNWTMGRRKPAAEGPRPDDAARPAASVHRVFPRSAE